MTGIAYYFKNPVPAGVPGNLVMVLADAAEKRENIIEVLVEPVMVEKPAIITGKKYPDMLPCYIVYVWTDADNYKRMFGKAWALDDWRGAQPMMRMP